MLIIVLRFSFVRRYGRVQNVKLLGRTESPGAATGASASATPSAGGSPGGVCATVAFMDIKSASKAHNVEHVLDERTLTTEYYEPAAIPSGAPSAGSSPAGSGYSGSSSSVNSAPPPAAAAAVTAATAAPVGARYHLTSVSIFAIYEGQQYTELPYYCFYE